MADFSVPKRIRSESNDEDQSLTPYHSDEDFDPNEDVDELSSIPSSLSIQVDDDTDASGSTSSMEHSGYSNNYPKIILGKDGTKWKEDISISQIPKSIETCIVNHVPTLTASIQNAKLITGT